MTTKSFYHLLIGVLFCCWLLPTAEAQISTGGKPYSFALRMQTVAPPPVLMPAINLGKLQAEDLLDAQAGQAPRFGEPIAVNLNMNNSGVWETLPDGGRLWRLSIFSSDFALIEMAENPKTAGYDVYFAGFDATTTAPSAATGIHHPRGDVKKISMENAALTGTNYGGTGGTATHWRVADWDSGTTEPGSSGSPIFSDATKRAMGFLSGGGAACGNDLQDWYGSLGYSWNNGGASDSRRRLRDHLDPGGLATFVDGSANPCNFTPPVPCTGTTYSSAANLNLAIPDNNSAGLSNTINVAATGNVSELKCVTVNLTHTWTGDLVAPLTYVSSGTAVQLFRRLNANTSTAVGESSNLSGAYTFCATGASFAGAGNGGLSDYVIPPGTYAQSSVSLQATPAQNTNTFANFVGLSLNGDWRLTIADYSGDDTGTLSSWSFEACSDAATCPTFSGAPANVGITNSACNSGTVSGGSITAPGGTPSLII